jgi:predicted acyltransferase
VTAGFALVFLSVLYWIIEIRGWRGLWTMPFLVFGMNAIVAYCLDETLWIPLSHAHSIGADGNPIPWQQYLNDQIARVASPANASLLFSIGAVLFCWVLMWLLYRRRIFVKL